MKKEQFDNYKFGVKTIAKWDDEWHSVKGVDFEDGTVLVAGIWVRHSEIEDVMEEQKEDSL